MIVLVVGPSRTGTSMLGRLLQNTSVCLTVPELHFFDEFFSADLGYVPDKIELATKLPKIIARARSSYYSPIEIDSSLLEESNRLAESFFGLDLCDLYCSFLQSERISAGKQFVCEQTPRVLDVASELSVRRRDILIISTIRNPFSVVRSQKYRHRRGILGGKNIQTTRLSEVKDSYDPIVMSLLWSRAAGDIDALRTLERVFLFNYDEYLLSKTSMITSIMSFVGIAGDGIIAEVSQEGSSFVADDGSKEPNAGDSSFELSPREKSVISFFCNREAEKFGYVLGRVNYFLLSQAIIKFTIMLPRITYLKRDLIGYYVVTWLRKHFRD